MKHSVCSSIVHDGQTATHIAIAISREISKSASTFFYANASKNTWMAEYHSGGTSSAQTRNPDKVAVMFDNNPRSMRDPENLPAARTRLRILGAAAP